MIWYIKDKILNDIFQYIFKIIDYYRKLTMPDDVLPIAFHTVKTSGIRKYLYFIMMDSLQIRFLAIDLNSNLNFLIVIEC